MERRIDAHIARTQFGQIMDQATRSPGRARGCCQACRISFAPLHRRLTGWKRLGPARGAVALPRLRQTTSMPKSPPIGAATRMTRPG